MGTLNLQNRMLLHRGVAATSRASVRRSLSPGTLPPGTGQSADRTCRRRRGRQGSMSRATWWTASLLLPAGCVGRRSDLTLLASPSNLSRAPEFLLSLTGRSRCRAVLRNSSSSAPTNFVAAPNFRIEWVFGQDAVRKTTVKCDRPSSLRATA